MFKIKEQNLKYYYLVNKKNFNKNKDKLYKLLKNYNKCKSYQV